MTTNHPVETVALRRLLWVGPLALVVSLVVNAVIRTLVLALSPSASLFFPLAGPQFIIFTIAGVLGAIVVFAIVARVAKRPLTWYRRIAVVALLLTFLPDLSLLAMPAGGSQPGVPSGMSMSGGIVDVGALMLMHIATAALTVWLLTTQTRAKPI